MKPRLNVHIAELVLHGFPHAERHAVADQIARALEAELAGRVLRAPVSAERLDAGAVRVRRADRSAAPPIGQALANAIVPRRGGR